MTACHLIADTQLALARDINLDLLDDPRIDIISALHSIRRALAFELQLREFVFIRGDDLTDFVTDRTRIDLDMIVNHRELSQQCLRDFAISRNNDFASLSIYDIKRDFFAQ